MSEFDAFEGTAPTEEDPAAAFLAREQDQMAELEGETLPAEMAENTGAPNIAIGSLSIQPMKSLHMPSGIWQDGAPNIAIGSQSIQSMKSLHMPSGIWQDENEAVLGSADTSSDAPPKTDEITETVNAAVDPTFADYGADNVEITDMFGGTPTEGYSMSDLGDAFASDPYSDVTTSSDPYAAITSQDRHVQEPEKIRVWREEQKENLAIKDAEAEVKREEWREIAKRELEDWYRHREEQQEKAKKNNREAEAAFCQERDESLPGHEWERVTRLCEFNPKAARNSKDVSRMRSILLQLKQTPLVR